MTFLFSRRRVVRAGAALAATLLSATGFAVAAPAPAPSPAPTASSIGFTVEPYAEPGALPRSEFNYDVQAGQSFTDRLVISNLTTTPKSFYVYIAGVYNTEVGGAIAARNRGEAPTDAATWVTMPAVASGELTVQPRSSAIVPLQLSVPADASPGDHGAALLAEEILPPVPKTKTGVQTLHRIGTEVSFRVAGPVQPALHIQGLSVSHHEGLIPYITGRGRATVVFEVVNTGNVTLKLDKAAFKMTGLFGHGIHKSSIVRAPSNDQSGLPTGLLPGNKTRFAVVFKGLPPLDIVSTAVSVKGEDSAGTPVAASRTTSFWLIPWVVLLVIVVIAVGYWFWRRRASRPPAAAQDPAIPTPPTPAPSDPIGASVQP